MKLTIMLLVAILFVACSSKKETKETPETVALEKKSARVSEEIMARGKTAFTKTCLACHQATGLGVPVAFPPLAKSDYLMADRVRAIKQVITGSQGEITVNGKKFNGVMPPQALTDQEIADVLTYAMNSWGNEAEAITLEEVQKVKSTLK